MMPLASWNPYKNLTEWGILTRQLSRCIDRGRHETERLYECRWRHCQSHFCHQEDLVEHVQVEHVHSKGQRYYCQWRDCIRKGKGFSARYRMVTHVRIHTKEKPYQCNMCHKRFSRQENLKIHIRAHTGEKPYACPHPGCNKTYSNSSDRSKHLRTHEVDRPFVCRVPQCQKRYTDPSSLRKHTKAHHKRESLVKLKLPSSERVRKQKFTAFPRRGSVDARITGQRVSTNIFRLGPSRRGDAFHRPDLPFLPVSCLKYTQSDETAYPMEQPLFAYNSQVKNVGATLQYAGVEARVLASTDGTRTLNRIGHSEPAPSIRNDALPNINTRRPMIVVTETGPLNEGISEMNAPKSHSGAHNENSSNGSSGDDCEITSRPLATAARLVNFTATESYSNDPLHLISTPVMERHDLPQVIARPALGHGNPQARIKPELGKYAVPLLFPRYTSERQEIPLVSLKPTSGSHETLPIIPGPESRRHNIPKIFSKLTLSDNAMARGISKPATEEGGMPQGPTLDQRQITPGILKPATNIDSLSHLNSRVGLIRLDPSYVISKIAPEQSGVARPIPGPRSLKQGSSSHINSRPNSEYDIPHIEVESCFEGDRGAQYSTAGAELKVHVAPYGIGISHTETAFPTREIPSPIPFLGQSSQSQSSTYAVHDAVSTLDIPNPIHGAKPTTEKSSAPFVRQSSQFLSSMYTGSVSVEELRPSSKFENTGTSVENTTSTTYITRETCADLSSRPPPAGSTPSTHDLQTRNDASRLSTDLAYMCHPALAPRETLRPREVDRVSVPHAERSQATRLSLPQDAAPTTSVSCPTSPVHSRHQTKLHQAYPKFDDNTELPKHGALSIYPFCSHGSGSSCPSINAGIPREAYEMFHEKESMPCNSHLESERSNSQDDVPRGRARLCSSEYESDGESSISRRKWVLGEGQADSPLLPKRYWSRRFLEVDSVPSSRFLVSSRWSSAGHVGFRGGVKELGLTEHRYGSLPCSPTAKHADFWPIDRSFCPGPQLESWTPPTPMPSTHKLQTRCDTSCLSTDLPYTLCHPTLAPHETLQFREVDRVSVPHAERSQATRLSLPQNAAPTTLVSCPTSPVHSRHLAKVGQAYPKFDDNSELPKQGTLSIYPFCSHGLGSSSPSINAGIPREAYEMFHEKESIPRDIHLESKRSYSQDDVPRGRARLCSSECDIEGECGNSRRKWVLGEGRAGSPLSPKRYWSRRFLEIDSVPSSRFLVSSRWSSAGHVGFRGGVKERGPAERSYGSLPCSPTAKHADFWPINHSSCPGLLLPMAPKQSLSAIDNRISGTVSNLQ